jgi:two-component system, sensor histidine kinase and response regulator
MEKQNNNIATILIVDDIQQNLSILNNILSDEGYNICLAISSEIALEFVQNEIPDLILLDIKMPGIDGYEVCTRLKADKRTREIPIIFISALNDINSKLKGFESGGVDYITKPFEFDEILVRVKTQILCQSLRKQLEKQNKELLELNQIQEEMQYIMQHDLKGPLTPLVHIPKIIKKTGPLTETQLKYLNKIEAAGYKVIKMINRTTDLVQMERGTYHFMPVPVDVMVVLENILECFENEIKSRKVLVDVFFNNKPFESGEAVWVQGEDLLLYSMLENLIRNALDASLTGQKVTINVMRNVSDKNTYQISIHNETSIPAEIQDHFFEKYATFGKIKGTGLGTYSAKLAADTMGGILKMKTSQEEGTSLTIDLPMTPA